MKYAYAFLAAAAVSFSAPLAAEQTSNALEGEVIDTDAAKLALAQAILDTSYPNDSHIALFQETTDQLEAQMAQSLDGVITDAGALEIVTKWQERASVETDAILLRNIPSLMNAWAVAFADIYTVRELQDILAFVSTPSGQAFMANQTKLISHPAFAEANQSFMSETMGVVTAKIPELIEELQRYEASKQSSAE